MDPADWRPSFRELLQEDAEGIPLSMYYGAHLGLTVPLLLARAAGAPWGRGVIATAARAGHVRTVIWLHLFGCPFRLEDVADIPDTACLRWLLQFAEPTPRTMQEAAANMPATVVLLAHPAVTPIHNVNMYRAQLMTWLDYDTSGHAACAAVVAARTGALPMTQDWRYWRWSARKLRMLESLPGAVARFWRRRAATVKLQAWWLAQYYTPGAPVWRARMLREAGELGRDLQRTKTLSAAVGGGVGLTCNGS